MRGRSEEFGWNEDHKKGKGGSEARQVQMGQIIQSSGVETAFWRTRADDLSFSTGTLCPDQHRKVNLVPSAEAC